MGIHDNEIGKIYGDFKVLEYLQDLSATRHAPMMKCQCLNCGTIVNKPLYNLKKGQMIKCKCGSGFRVDKDAMIGQIFGLLKVVEYDEEKSKIEHRSIFKCICQGECGGNEVFASASNLNAGNVTSCGCTKKGPNSYHAIPTVGLTFGDITALAVDEEATAAHGNRSIYYIGRCSQGHICTYEGSRLRNRHICPICGKRQPK